MRHVRNPLVAVLLPGLAVFVSEPASAGQVPVAASVPDIAITSRDRVYMAEQFSNTVTVVDPSTNDVLGVIRLGDTQPANLSPLYRGQVLVHGIGFSPDHKTLAVVSIGSNSVSFIDAASNAVKHITYVGRSPHEVFFTPDGREVWVTVRGEDYISVLDPVSYAEIGRITVPAGPGMQIFSPDGKYGYVCSSFTPDTVVITVADHKIVGHVKQDSPFCPNIAASPDGDQVWFTLKDSGKVQVFDAHPPFTALVTLDTGAITNHVNFVHLSRGTLAYVTVGGLNVVKAFRTDDFSLVATIPVGNLPHGLWPSGDGSRLYVGLENADALAVIDTSSNTVLATLPTGQAPQALAYVPNAVPRGDGRAGLEPLGIAGEATYFTLRSSGARWPGPVGAKSTSVTLFSQGLTQVLEAAVTGLEPKTPYVLALSTTAGGTGALQPLSAFVTNPEGSAIVNAVGPIRQIAGLEGASARRYLVVVSGTPMNLGVIVQVQN